MQLCTWAPTVFQGNQVVDRNPPPATIPKGADLQQRLPELVAFYESLGVQNLLVAQRWWGNGEDIEASSLDCLAMTAFFANCTSSINLITAIHPGFFQPTAIAKWGATISHLTSGRWSINVTSGWNMQEFDMYGIDKLEHDTRYVRSAEFIEVLRGAWSQRPFSYAGKYYQADQLELDPPPGHPLMVFQGGQSDAAITMAAQHSDWMFLNGGDEDDICQTIDRVSEACRKTGRRVRFAMYAAPLCRATDADAWAEIDARLARVDENLVTARKQRLAGGATGMWSKQDPLSMLDSNEGYAARLIGSPDTVWQRIERLHELGIDMLHLDLRDQLFNTEVLPQALQL